MKKINISKKIELIYMKVNKPVRRFVLAFLIGFQIVIMIIFFYFTYKDKIIAGEGIRDTLTYQGKITNSDGVPPPDGSFNMKFKIYDQATSGDLLWTEVWDSSNQGIAGSKVTVTNGVFSVELNSLCGNWTGACSSNGGVTFQTDSFYLQVELDDNGDDNYDEVFLPRKRFTATPYSMNTDKLDGRDSSEFLLKEGGSMTGSLTVPQITDSSVVAFYQFNGDADDSGSNSLDGTLTGTVTPTVSSHVLEINGVDQHTVVSDDDLLSFGDSLTDDAFSISAWVYMEDATDFPIVAKGIYNTNAEYRFYTDTNDKFKFITFDESVTDCYVGKFSDDALTAYEGQWIFLVGTYDGDYPTNTTASFKLYLNGEVMAMTDYTSNPGSYLATENESAEMYMARNNLTYGKGKIDDVKIIKRELSASEIKQLFESQSRDIVQVNEMTLNTLKIEGIDDEDGDGVYDIEGGNLIWDEVYNRFKFSTDDSNLTVGFYAPGMNVSSERGERDYTHYPDSNLILGYDFADGQGGTVTDLEGNANGTMAGDVDWTNQGYIGYGMEFPGGTGDYVSFSDPGLADDQGSIELWVKLNDYSASEINRILVMSADATNQINIYKDTDASLKTSIAGTTIDSTYDFSDNNWHHVAFIWHSDGSLEYYIDGVLYNDSTTYTASSLTVSSFTNFYLGVSSAGDTATLDGALDSIAIYSDTLTASEVKAHYYSAFENVFVTDNISDGTIITSLENLIDLPTSINEISKIDPVYFNDGARALALSFAEGFGTSSDSTVNSLTATISGASWLKEGYYGPALDFDGTDDFLVVSHASSIDVATEDFSVEMWVKGSSAGNNGNVLISKKNSNAGYEISLDSSDRIVVWLGDGTDTFTSTGWGQDMSDGAWNHFLVSINRTDDTINIINKGWWSNHGSLIDFSSSNIDSLTNTGDLYIAKDSTGNNFAGALDSVILYKSRLLNLYDGYNRISNSPQSDIINSHTTGSTAATVGIINQSTNNGGFALSTAIFNSSNTSGYPVGIFNLAHTSDVYNLLTFGTISTSTYAQTTFGNLTWDDTNSKFILSQSLEVQGDLEADYLITDSNELLAFDIVRYLITGTDVTNSYCDISWTKATTKKVANLHSVMVDESHASDLVTTDDWTNTSTAVDLASQYDGTNIRVIMQSGAWSVDDIVTVFIVYEK